MIIPLPGGAVVDKSILLTPFSAPIAAPTGGWSSLIGIVTAIVGNVLISFALNTQRYAHVRLEKEQHEKEKAHINAKNNNDRDHSYGAIQNDIAEERSKRNALGSKRKGVEYEEGDHSNETDALIPRIKSPTPSHGSGSSDEDYEKGEDFHAKRGNYLKSPYWWVGIVLMIIGEAGNFLAYGFAPASIVSPLGVVALISNCIIAPIMLGERFRKRDILGVLIAIGGAVTVVVSAKGSNPKLGPDKIWNLIRRWQFETYLGITVGCIIILSVLSNKYGEKLILIDLGLVGLYGGYTALSTKGVASLFSSRLWSVFSFPVFYLLVAVLVVTAVMQIKYVNRALQRFDSTQVIPTQFVMFTIFVIAGSAVLYGDFENESADKAVQFVGGCALTFLGVWCITSGRDRNPESEEHDGDEVEEGITLVDEEHTDQAHQTQFQQIPGGSLLDAKAARVPIPQTPNQAPLDLSDSLIDSPASFMTATSNVRATPLLKSTSAQLPPSTSLSRSNSRTQPQDQIRRLERIPTSSPTRRSRKASEASRVHAPHPIGQHDDSQLEAAAVVSPLGFKGSRPRLSFAGVMPGPLTSPLSSGLSAVVADSRRRSELRLTESYRGRPRIGSRGTTVQGLNPTQVEIATQGDDGARNRRGSAQN